MIGVYFNIDAESYKNFLDKMVRTRTPLFEQV